MKIFYCELKRHKVVTPQLCAICPRIERCRAFRRYYAEHTAEYLDFVSKIVAKFPEKYRLEVIFMAEKQTFVQIVDRQTGVVERVTDMKEIEAMSVEDKLALARAKTLYVVSHRLEPVIKVEMKRVSITPVPEEKATAETSKTPAAVKGERPVKQAEIPLPAKGKGKPGKK